MTAVSSNVSKSKLRRNRAAILRAKLWESANLSRDPVLQPYDPVLGKLVFLESLLLDLHWCMIGQWNVCGIVENDAEVAANSFAKVVVGFDADKGIEKTEEAQVLGSGEMRLRAFDDPCAEGFAVARPSSHFESPSGLADSEVIRSRAVSGAIAVQDVEESRVSVLHGIDIDDMGDVVSTLERHAKVLLQKLRPNILTWPPVLGENEEEGRSIIASMVCDQVGDTMQETLSDNGTPLSEPQLAKVKERIINVVAVELNSWKRSLESCGMQLDDGVE